MFASLLAAVRRQQPPQLAKPEWPPASLSAALDALTGLIELCVLDPTAVPPAIAVRDAAGSLPPTGINPPKEIALKLAKIIGLLHAATVSSAATLCTTLPSPDEPSTAEPTDRSVAVGNVLPQTADTVADAVTTLAETVDNAANTVSAMAETAADAVTNTVARIVNGIQKESAHSALSAANAMLLKTAAALATLENNRTSIEAFLSNTSFMKAVTAPILLSSCAESGGYIGSGSIGGAAGQFPNPIEPLPSSLAQVHAALQILDGAARRQPRRVAQLLHNTDLFPTLFGHLLLVLRSAADANSTAAANLLMKFRETATVVVPPLAGSLKYFRSALPILVEAEAVYLERMGSYSTTKREERAAVLGGWIVEVLLGCANQSVSSEPWDLVPRSFVRHFRSRAHQMLWLPQLMCRIGHLASVRRQTRRCGLLHLLREISLGAWPLPWRRDASHEAAAAAGVAGQLRESAGCALCCLGDNMRPTASLGRPGSRGVRILSIDGGGTRGMGTIVALRAIETACGGRPIHQLFDVICGTSTGGILAVALGVLKRPLDEVEEMYRDFAGRVFAPGTAIYRAGRSVLAGGMYPVAPLESILRDYTRDGNAPMREFGCGRAQLWPRGDGAPPHDADDCGCQVPRVFVVSSAVGKTQKPAPFLFRNYGYSEGSPQSRYPGCSHRPVWECLRATTAAPGYFQEFVGSDDVFQDGALTANNPTGIAIHEALCLFPGQPIGCVVSLGTGLFPPQQQHSAGLMRTMRGAASLLVDTEVVHVLLEDLLAPTPTEYVRINPEVTPMSLDENKPGSVSKLQAEFAEFLQSKDGVDGLDRTKAALELVGKSVGGVARAAKMFLLAGL